MTKPKKKTFIVFVYPIFLISGVKETEVKERAPEKVKMPKGAYCFYYFDECGTKESNFSKTYYPGGEILTRKSLIKKFPKFDHVVNVLKVRGINKVILTRLGNLVHFDPDDSIILPEKKK